MIAKFLQLKTNEVSLMYYQLLPSWPLSLLAKMRKDIESPPSCHPGGKDMAEREKCDLVSSLDLLGSFLLQRVKHGV